MYLYSSLSNTHTHTLFLPLPLTCSHRWRTARGGGGGIRRGTPSPPPPTLRTTSGLSPGSRWPSPVWPSQHGCLAQTSLPRSEPQYSPPCNKHETRSESTQHVYSVTTLLEPHTQRRRRWWSWSNEKDSSPSLSSLSERQRNTPSPAYMWKHNWTLHLCTIWDASD